MAIVGRVEEPCPVVLLDAYPSELDLLLGQDHPSGEIRLRTWQALRRAAELADAKEPPTRVGARVPVLLHEEGELSCGELVVVALDGAVVSAAKTHAAAERVSELIHRVDLGPACEPNLVAARIAHYAAERLVREVLEQKVRDELLAMEKKAVESAQDAAGGGTGAEASSLLIGRLQELSNRVSAIEPELRRVRRGRCSSWRFGAVRFDDVVETAAQNTPARRIYRAYCHVDAATTEAERLRHDAHVVTHGLTATDQIRQAAEGFQRAATALTAALAGPGLLFAAWEVDVWSGPFLATALAAVLALVLLLAVLWFLLQLQTPKRDLSPPILAGAVGFVVFIFGAGLIAPSLSDDSDVKQTREAVSDTRDILRRGAVEQQQQMRLLRREIRRLRTGRRGAP